MRIETYVHSDSLTENKGAAMVRVLSQTDFAARTERFSKFAKACARYAYAASTEAWEELVKEYPDIEHQRLELQTELKETITVDQIRILTLTRPEPVAI